MFRVQNLESEVEVEGFRVKCLGFWVGVLELRIRVQGLGLSCEGSGLKV